MTPDDLKPLIDHVVGRVHERYAPQCLGELDLDDITQELYAYTCEEKVARNFDKWDGDGERHRLRLALYGVARMYAEQVRAHAHHYDVKDLSWYTPEGLSNLIPLALDPAWDDATASPEEPTGFTSGGAPAHEGSNLLAMVCDIRRALGSTYGPSDIPLFDPLEETGMARLQELCDSLGGERPEAPFYREFHRKAIPNRVAQQITRRSA